MPTPAPITPGATRTPASSDYALLAVAIVAVSTSGPLIRYATAPALATAMWRNLLAVPVVGLAAWRRPRPTRTELKLMGWSGLLLAVHFATFIPAISYTSVSSAVALVAMQPAWAAIIARVRGEVVPRDVWVGIGIAFLGVLALSGVDFSVDRRALFGDALALVGGMLAAGYVTVGAEVRRTVDTSVYATVTYGIAAGALLVMCLIGNRDLVGFDTGTWLAIGGLTLGAQLLGHTLINRVLVAISPTAVSVAILFEILGATILAALAFDETPPLAAIPAGLGILLGIVIVIRAGRRQPMSGVPVD